MAVPVDEFQDDQKLIRFVAKSKGKPVASDAVKALE
jgi:hypothetical protein